MHLGATRVGLRSTRRAQARAAVRARSVLDRTRRKSSAHRSRNTRVRYSFTEKGKKKMWVSGCGIDRQQSKAKGAMPEQRSLAFSWFR